MAPCLFKTTVGAGHHPPDGLTNSERATTMDGSIPAETFLRRHFVLLLSFVSVFMETINTEFDILALVDTSGERMRIASVAEETKLTPTIFYSNPIFAEIPFYKFRFVLVHS